MSKTTKRNPLNNTIEVILLVSDKHLGEKFEIVRVKPSFAKNVLLPKNIAVLADASNKNKFAQKMKAAEIERKKKAANLDEMFTKLHTDGGIILTRKANADGTLYAKVDENDIINTIKDMYGLELDSHCIKLKKKITTLGQFSVPFLYKELKKDILITVEQDPEEAKKLEKHRKSTKHEEEPKEEVKVKKTREEIAAEREAAKQAKRTETIKRLKEKFKD